MTGLSQLKRDLGIAWTFLRGKSGGTNGKDVGEFYDQSGHVYGTLEGLRAHELYAIKEHLPRPPASLLDIGCGAGRTTCELLKMGYEVTAIDLSPRLLEMAAEKCGGATYRIMDATKLEFSTNEFDGAIFSHNGLDCLVPVSERLKVLREVFRVVKPDGLFYLSSHNALGKLSPGVWNTKAMALWLYGWVLRILWQARNRKVWQGYWWYHDVDGWQLLYSGRPSKSIKQFASVGWNVNEMFGRGDTFEQIGDRAQRIWRLTFCEHHVQYVLSKPSDAGAQ